MGNASDNNRSCFNCISDWNEEGQKGASKEDMEKARNMVIARETKTGASKEDAERTANNVVEAIGPEGVFEIEEVLNSLEQQQQSA